MEIGPQTHLIERTSISTFEKRIVLMDREGMTSIMGLCHIQPPDMLSLNHEADQDEVLYSLIKVTQRSVIYREIVPPEVSRSGLGDGSFNKHQR